MLTKGNRFGGQPFLLEGGRIIKPTRISFTSQGFPEEWMQRLLHEHPEVLPVQEIEAGFAPLIPVGREISVAAGSIDNLFVSPEGYLTLVETKLWRNPEARREVVGQILDYAKDLARWSYTDLDRRIRELATGSAAGLVDTVKKYYPLDETEERNFIDNVSKNLGRGRLLLLIVGDGIRESVEEMVEYLSRSPQLYFTLALIELQVFQVGDDPRRRLVIPQLVTRTREITRAIVRVEGVQPEQVALKIETDLDAEPPRSPASGSRRLLTAEEFFEQLQKNKGPEAVTFAQRLIRDCEALGLETVWNSGSFSLKLPDPQGSGLRIGVFNVDRTGYIYLGYSQGQLEKLQLPLELSYDFAAQTAALLPGIDQHQVQKGNWNKFATLHDFQKQYDQMIKIVAAYIEKIRKSSLG
ncbi:MAG: hypothetical protein DYG98_27795 [Haliscomenobacteraceae bacterium CHB4]|nr:hypothetical protein [Haliscomenobacteraceae bacterium CHB4]